MKNYLSFFFLLKPSFSKQIIKNARFPSCRNCIYFKPYSLGEYTSSLSHCQKFGTKSILTDEITYDYADLCRSDEDKCGKNGKYFEKEENVDLKIMKHSLVKWSPLISLGFLYVTLLWLMMSHS